MQGFDVHLSWHPHYLLMIVHRTLKLGCEILTDPDEKQRTQSTFSS